MDVTKPLQLSCFLESEKYFRELEVLPSNMPLDFRTTFEQLIESIRTHTSIVVCRDDNELSEMTKRYPDFNPNILSYRRSIRTCGSYFLEELLLIFPVSSRFFIKSKKDVTVFMTYSCILLGNEYKSNLDCKALKEFSPMKDKAHQICQEVEFIIGDSREILKDDIARAFKILSIKDSFILSILLHCAKESIIRRYKNNILDNK